MMGFIFSILLTCSPAANAVGQSCRSDWDCGYGERCVGATINYPGFCSKGY